MNVTVTNIIQELPPYKGQERLIKRRQDTYDIIRDILKMHEKCAHHYDTIADQFWKGDAKATARDLFNFMKANVGYVVEPSNFQSTKTPAAILSEGKEHGGDCKHYASFIVGIAEALRRKGYPIKGYYRFASYDNSKRNPGHVFAIIEGPDQQELWVDPVLSTFNQRNPLPTYFQNKIPPAMDTKIGELYEISGITTRMPIPGGTEYTSVPKAHWLDTHFTRHTALQPGEMVVMPAVSGHHKPHHHGKFFTALMDSPLSPLHPGIPMPGLDKHIGAHHKPHHHGKFFTALMDSPLSPLHPGIPMPGLDKHIGGPHGHGGGGFHGGGRPHPWGGGFRGGGYNSFVPAVTEVVYPDYAPQYDIYGNRIGKAKKKKGGHGLHIKIKPGKLLKKFGGAAPRNAFLALVKINFLKLGTKMNAGLTDASKKKKLMDMWKKMGGNPNKLSTAIHQGVGTYNKLHKKHTAMNGMFMDNEDDSPFYMSGFDHYKLDDYYALGYVDEDMYDTASVGFAPAAIPALLVAAAPIIVAFKNILKSFGVNADDLHKGAVDADQDVIANHNAGGKAGKGKKKKKGGGDDEDDADAGEDDGDPGGVQPDGSVDHGGGVTTKVTNNSDGTQTMHTDVADDAGDDDNTDDEAASHEAGGKVTKGGGGVPAGGALQEAIANSWDWVKDHKTYFFVAGGLLATFFIVKAVMSNRKPKRRR